MRSIKWRFLRWRMGIAGSSSTSLLALLLCTTKTLKWTTTTTPCTTPKRTTTTTPCTTSPLGKPTWIAPVWTTVQVTTVSISYYPLTTWKTEGPSSWPVVWTSTAHITSVWVVSSISPTTYAPPLTHQQLPRSGHQQLLHQHHRFPPSL